MGTLFKKTTKGLRSHIDPIGDILQGNWLHKMISDIIKNGFESFVF